MTLKDEIEQILNKFNIYRCDSDFIEFFLYYCYTSSFKDNFEKIIENETKAMNFINFFEPFEQMKDFKRSIELAIENKKTQNGLIST